MANAKILRLEPNATYIPLTRVGVLRWVTRKICVTQHKRYQCWYLLRWVTQKYPTRMVLRRSGI